jgi:hypothetical protein
MVRRPAHRCLSAEVHEDGYSQQDDREDPEGRIAHSSFLSHAPILPPIQCYREIPNVQPELPESIPLS